MATRVAGKADVISRVTWTMVEVDLLYVVTT